MKSFLNVMTSVHFMKHDYTLEERYINFIAIKFLDQLLLHRNNLTIHLNKARIFGFYAHDTLVKP